MLKEGKTVAEVYDSASAMVDPKKIQNIKQKVISAVNPVGHSFEALAKIKEASNLKDKYLLWKVQMVDYVRARPRWYLDPARKDLTLLFSCNAGASIHYQRNFVFWMPSMIKLWAWKP